MLFSATQTTKVADLARISLRPGPTHIDIDGARDTSTVATLSQGYIVCPSDQRFLLLYTFLRKYRNKKVVVFFSSCNSVKYHAEILNYIDIQVLELHVGVLNACYDLILRELIYLARGSKSSKSAPILSSNSSMRHPVFSFAQTLQRVVSIYLKWTGSYSSILLMIRVIIYIVLVGRLAQAKKEKACCSFSKPSLGS